MHPTSAGLLLALLPQEPLVLRDVTIVDVVAGAHLPAQTVEVREGRIASVAPAGSEPLPEGARVVDGTGRYLIPGLWDMHTHALSPAGVELQLPLLLAHGVTGMRDMSSALSLDELAGLLDEVEAGALRGPRWVTPGPLVDGPGRPPGALGPNVIVVATPDEARTAVRDLAARGADFVKVYNRLTPALHAALADEAASVGLPLAGHVPHLVAAADAARAGQRSFDHLQGVLAACSPVGGDLLAATAGLLEGSTGTEAVERVLDLRRRVPATFDAERAAAFFGVLVERGTWQCPTLVSNRALAFADRADFQADPRLACVPASSRPAWRNPATLPEGRAHAVERYGRCLEVVGRMRAAGVRILAGTDLGVPHVYAGASLHDELELLVQAGLSPLDALRAATLEPAAYLDRLDELGTVEEGKRADLVLLDADPLADVRNVRRIRAVVHGGRLLDRGALDALLVEAEALAAEL